MAVALKYVQVLSLSLKGYKYVHILSLKGYKYMHVLSLSLKVHVVGYKYVHVVDNMTEKRCYT